MIICQCAVVSDRSVAEAVAAGARTMAQACRATSAGRDCGSCVFTVKRVFTRVMTEHRHNVAGAVTEVCDACSA